MSEINLKSVTFPQLDDEYIIGDESLSIEGAAADSKTVGDKFAGAEADLENIVNASAVQTKTNNTPYSFRKCVGGHYEMLDKVVGGSVAWNQWATAGGGTTNLATKSFNSATNELTITPTNYSTEGVGVYGIAPIQGNHVTVQVASLKATKPATIRLGTDSTPFYFNVTTSYTLCMALLKKDGSLVMYADPRNVWSSGDYFVAKDVMAFDLTQMFGSTVADAIYAMEQATAGSGVAYFRSLFPNAYYPYNSGELMSVSGVSAHNMTGKNLCPKFSSITTNGITFTAKSDGTVVANGTSTATAICAISDVNLTCDSSLILSGCPSGGGDNAYRVDVNNGSSYKDVGSGATIAQKTTISNVRIRIASGVTVNNLVFTPMIRFASVTDGTYEPYEIHSYPLDSDLTLRGIPKWNNGLYYDGDTYEADGTVNRKYGIVDLGTLTWYMYGSGFTGLFYSDGAASAIGATDAQVTHGICSSYLVVPNYNNDGGRGSATEQPNMTIRFRASDGRLYAVNHSFDSASDASAFKASLSGVYLVYEKATTTTENAQPYQKAQICDPNGTEEFVSDTIVPTGHETEYPLTINDIAPTANGTYTLKCTVSGGVKTYEWVSA